MGDRSSNMVSALRISAIVLHGIKKSVREAAIEPELSEAETAISDQVRGFLQEQIASALKDGRQIVEVPEMSTVPGMVRAVWKKDSTLLTASQTLARVLQTTQPAISPEGLLMVADVTVDGARGFLLAKLEHEKGTRAVREKNDDGDLVYSMQFLDNLFFTEGSKVYKIGYFPLPDNVDDPLEGLVVDKQAAGHAVAHYFRETFLGCGWKERPELATERFMDTVQKWIDSREDPEKRTKYQLALITEMQSQRNSLSVAGFVDQYIDVEDRDNFRRTVGQALPSATITKDVSLVQGRLANVRWDTRSGTVVIATPDAVEEGIVTVSSGEDGTEIRVRDEITGTTGTGRFRPGQSG
jgi:hypothetical protein